MRGGCDTIHCGFWINWAKGAVVGSTVTVPYEYGLIISAVLALFVRIVGDSLWGIICFVVHQLRASPKDQDDIYHQLQLTLRNDDSESKVIRDVFKIGQSRPWGGRLKAYGRGLPIIAIATFHGLLIFLAGTLSSRAIAPGDEVLMLSGSCGWMDEVPIEQMSNLDDDRAFNVTNALIVTATNNYRRGAGYSRGCYRGEGATDCSTFVRKIVPYKANASATCPFDSEICNGRAITIDTGFIHSDRDLGLNTRKEDRISIRKETTCVPLNAEKYTKGWQSYSDEENLALGLMINDSVKGWSMGPTLDLEDPYKRFTHWVSRSSLRFDERPYSLASIASLVDNKTALNFDPIPELRRKDRDVTVVSLINRIAYRRPVTDPFFSATNCKDAKVNTTTKSCITTNGAGFLGCTERYQFCTSSNCSPYTGLYGIKTSTSDTDSDTTLPLTKSQQAVYNLLWKLFWAMQLDYQVGLLGHDNLIANDYLWSAGFNFGLSAQLPDNQWHLEVANWMNTSLAYLQRGTLDFASVPTIGGDDTAQQRNHIVRPSTPELRELCDKIKARSSDHVSFSGVGIFLELSLGLLIIVTNFFLSRITAWVQARIGKGLYKRIEWIENSMFQLQRMAAEGRGVVEWEGKEDDVPWVKRVGTTFSLVGEKGWEGGGGRVGSGAPVGARKGYEAVGMGGS